MSIKLSFVCLLVALLITSCRDSEPIDFSEYYVSVLPNTWVHDYNRCERVRMNFRPDGEVFLSNWRTRSRLELLPDHSAVYDIRTLADPHINDECLVIRGTWTFDSTFNTLEVLSKDGSSRVVFNVHAAGRDFINISYKEFDCEQQDK